MRAFWLTLATTVALTACASSADRRPDGRPDRTRDPEFEAAREEARPEFETQAEALAAGVYEPFVHPDSVGGRPAEGARDEAAALVRTPRDRGDPSTEELLGTLGAGDQYNRGDGAVPHEDPAASGDASPTGVWTLQTGAFGSETGALVRKRELERRFPDLPVWHVRGGDGLFRVHLGSFADRGTAERALERVAAGGLRDVWIVRAP